MPVNFLFYCLNCIVNFFISVVVGNDGDLLMISVISLGRAGVVVDDLDLRGGVIDLELDEKAAPITVENFLKLVNAKFYDGTIFHRVIPGFMIQGGDPEGTGMGGPGWTIKGEFAQNGVNNPIKHKRGVISMARAMDPDSAGSQFFIMHADADYLDGQYAAFGHVVSGMDVVDRIAATPTNRWAGDRPYEDQVMETVRVVEG